MPDKKIYLVSDRVKAKRDVLDMIKKDVEYTIYLEENNLGTLMYYLKDDNGKKANAGWGFKTYELELHFDKI